VVLVQTLAPTVRSLAHAARHDADAFLSEELRHRRALGYPPFGSLIRVVCSAEHPDDALAIAAALHERLAVPGATVLGPAPLFRLRGKARNQLVIKAADRAGSIAATGAAVDSIASLASKRNVSVSVDVDPQ
jgi:primosomal protein N' (replication factor Y)